MEQQDALRGNEESKPTLLTKLLSAAKLYHRLNVGDIDEPAAIESVLADTVIIEHAFIELVTMHRDDIDLVRQTMVA